MYLEHFQFAVEPFAITPDPRFLFLSVRHEEALAHLIYGLREGGGFVALTGEVGTGKTTLCHSLLEQLPSNVDVALVLNPKVNALELIATICDELAISYPLQTNSIKVIVDALNRYLLDAHARGRRTVVLIDEAQNLSLDVLEQIRLLTNLETKETKLMQIILVGQPELNDLLKRRELRQLNQRIIGRYHLKPLNFAETTDYVKHRLSKAQGQQDIFNQGAINDLYRHSGGVPRLINTIADRALLGAFSDNDYHVKTAHVKRAAAEILNTQSSRLWLFGIVGMLLIGIGFAGLVYWQSQQAEISPLSFPNLMQEAPVLAEQLPQQSGDGPKTLVALLNEEVFTLPTAFSHLFAILGLPVDTPSESNPCQLAKTHGYACLAAQGHWRQLLGFDRPVILELENASSQRKHVVLRSVSATHASIDLNHGNSQQIPINEVVSLWNGSYVLLWKLPDSGSTLLHEGESSRDVIGLRDSLALFDDLAAGSGKELLFDKELKERVVLFQRAKGIDADGVVGPMTWLLLSNLGKQSGRPTLSDSGE